MRERFAPFFLSVTPLAVEAFDLAVVRVLQCFVRGCGAGAFVSVERWMGCVRICVLLGVPSVRVCSTIACGSGAPGTHRLGRGASED